MRLLPCLRLSARPTVTEATQSLSTSTPPSSKDTKPPLRPFAHKHTFSAALTHDARPASLKTFLQDIRHPFHIPAVRRLEELAARPFNFNVHVPVTVSPKAVVRNWAKRRVQAAFKAVLSARGYDVDGKVIVADRAGQAVQLGGMNSDGRKSTTVAGTDDIASKTGDTTRSEPKVRPGRDLRGSVNIVVDKTVVPQKFDDVKARCEPVLQTVLKEMRARGHLSTGNVSQKRTRQRAQKTGGA